MTPDKRVEEIVRQFKDEFISDRGYGEIPQYVPAQFDFSDYTDWLRTTLTQDRQAIADALVEALDGKYKLENATSHVETHDKFIVRNSECTGYNKALDDFKVIIKHLLESKN